MDRKLRSLPRATLSCFGLQQKKRLKEEEECRDQQTGGAAAVLLPYSAVAGSEHPAIPEQHTTAVVVVVGSQQADLPGPGVGWGLGDLAHLDILKRCLLGQNMLGRHL